MKAAPRQWPVEPLMKALNLTSCSQLMRAVLCNGLTARQAIDEGLTDRQADKWAVRFGHHPIEIWPNWCDDKEQAA